MNTLGSHQVKSNMAAGVVVPQSAPRMHRSSIASQANTSLGDIEQIAAHDPAITRSLIADPRCVSGEVVS
jgi:hypothetical protein